MTATVLLDSNLLVLLVVGRAGVEHINPRRAHRAIKAYDRAAFDKLIRLLTPFAGIQVTPHILAETSNLARKTSEADYPVIARAFQAVVEQAIELHIPAKEAVHMDEFVALGLTDAAVVQSVGTAVLLTDDRDLYLAARRRSLQALKFSDCF